MAEETKRHETTQPEEILDPETIDRANESTEQIGEAILIKLRKIKEEGGDADKYLEDVYVDFSSSLYARLTSRNLKPEPFDTALKGATALLTPEPVMEHYDEWAQGMVDALRKRYSIK